MQATSGCRKELTLLLIVAVLMTTTGLYPAFSHGQDHLSLNYAPLPVVFPLPQQAIADFDSDRLPDLAELVANGFHKNIHLTLSSPWITNLHFSTESQQPGDIHAEDIDHDNDTDLVWISDQKATQTALWLNNGTGEFTYVTESSACALKIKRLIGNASQNSLLDPCIGGRLRATGTSGFSLLVPPENSVRAYFTCV